MVKLWRELTRQGFPSNRRIKDAWKLSKSGTEKRLRGDRPGTSEDWKVWAEQLLPLPQPEQAREFLEEVIRGAPLDELEELAARLQQKGPGESLKEESPNRLQAQDSSATKNTPAKDLTAQELLSRWQHTRAVGLQDPQQARRFANLVADQREQIMQAIQALDTRILGLRGNQGQRRAAYTQIKEGEGDPCDLDALRREYKAMGVLLDQAKAERDCLQAMLREAGRFADHVAQREYLKDLFGGGADPLAEAEMQADRLLSQAEKSELSMGQVKKLEEDLNRIFDPLRPPALDQAVTANQAARWKIEDLTQALQSDEYRTRSETDELLLEMERCQQILAETEPLRAHWERQEQHLEPLRARLLVIQERARDRALRSAAPV